MIKMNCKCLLVTPHNIQDELIKNEIEQNRLQFESFKEQKYNEILREYKQLQNNWNELKQYISEQLQYYSLCEDDYKEFNILDSVESKMQELEQWKDE